MIIKKIPGILADAVYPRRCPVCDAPVAAGGGPLCNGCADKLTVVGDAYCMKCGKPVAEDEEYCGDCKRAGHAYDEGRAALVYDEYSSKSIYRFKYGGRKEYARFYGKLISDLLGESIGRWKPDAMIPVPVHKDKLVKRGYNQAYLIAKELSKRTGIPVNDSLVCRRTSTKVQKELGAAERQNNLKKAFIVTQNVVKLETVMVVDDIYTTGATVDAMARCLKGAGIKKVFFVSLCIGRGN